MSFAIHPAVAGGIERVQHHIVLLNKVASRTVTISPVNLNKTILLDSWVSTKTVSVLTTFTSPTELLVNQSDKKAVTTVRIQLIELK